MPPSSLPSRAFIKAVYAHAPHCGASIHSIRTAPRVRPNEFWSQRNNKSPPPPPRSQYVLHIAPAGSFAGFRIPRPLFTSLASRTKLASAARPMNPFHFANNASATRRRLQQEHRLRSALHLSFEFGPTHPSIFPSVSHSCRRPPTQRRRSVH